MVSCLIPATSALFRLAFATAPSIPDLTWPLRLTRWLILQKARRHTLPRRAIVLRPFVSIRFQVLFHSPYRGSFHLSFTVLVHYRSLNVFGLGKWASQIPAGLACPAVLRYPTRVCPVSPTGLSPSMAQLSRRFCYQTDLSLSCVGPYNPTSI